MTQLIRSSLQRRQHHRPYRQWSADEKASILAAYRQRGLSATAFCRETGVPLATFALWKRDAGLTRPAPARRRATLARVTVVPSPPLPEETVGEPRPGVRLIVRGAAGHEAALDGVDGETAVRLVALVLGRRR